MVDDGGTDWTGYYAWSAGREPRPLLLAACQELGAGQDRTAIDLGCGKAPMRWNCWLAAGWSRRSMLSQRGSRCSGYASRPRLPDGSGCSARPSLRRTCRALT